MLSGTRLFFALGSGMNPASPSSGEANSVPEKPVSGGLFAPLDGAPGGER
ncbi:hypothetical protein IWY39_000218 [Sphingobium sp. JAI105]|nr:hypothetical protein [Sphingobium sp. JAI105]MBG6116414.1 hypothetical protein [Sphingobium sp. JAI105]